MILSVDNTTFKRCKDLLGWGMPFLIYLSRWYIEFCGRLALVFYRTSSEICDLINLFHCTRMNFAKLENTDWTCTNMDVTYSGNFNETTVTGVNVPFGKCNEKIVTPSDMSYSCGDFSLKNGTTKLSFGHFQVGTLFKDAAYPSL